MVTIPTSWRREYNRYCCWGESYHRYTRIRRIRKSVPHRVHDTILYTQKITNIMQHTAIAFIAIATGFLTSIAVIVWSIRQPELREGWRAVWKRVKEAREAQYNPDDITDCIRMYWRIVGDIADAPGLDELQALTMDMEIFRRKFTDKVPDGLYDEKMLAIIRIYDTHWKRIMYKNKVK